MARMFQESHTKDATQPTRLLVSSTILAVLLIATATTILIIVLPQSKLNWLCAKIFAPYISLRRRVKKLLR